MLSLERVRASVSRWTRDPIEDPALLRLLVALALALVALVALAVDGRLVSGGRDGRGATAPHGAPGSSGTRPDDRSAGPAPGAIHVAPSGLAIPVLGVGPERLRDTFLAARGGGRRHDAIDIMAPRATPVVAAADGTVLRLYRSRPGGLTVYQLGDDDRTVYYYAHLDGYAAGIGPGDRVRRGDRLGFVGDTGNAPAGVTHLHFAIWTVDDPDDFWRGEAVNPYPLLTGR